MNRGGAVCPTRQRTEIFGFAARAADPGETVRKQTAVEVLSNHLVDHGAERAIGSLEELLVATGEAIEMIHDQPVEGDALRGAGSIDRRSLACSVRFLADPCHGRKGDARRRRRARQTGRCASCSWSIKSTSSPAATRP